MDKSKVMIKELGDRLAWAAYMTHCLLGGIDDKGGLQRSHAGKVPQVRLGSRVGNPDWPLL